MTPRRVAIVVLLLVAVVSPEQWKALLKGVELPDSPSPATAEDSHRYYAGVFGALADCLEKTDQIKTYADLQKLLELVGESSDASEPIPADLGDTIKSEFSFLAEKSGQLSSDDKSKSIKACKTISERFLSDASS